MSKDTDYVTVSTTMADGEAARTLSRAIVDAQLAACVQRIPIQSVYRWKGEVEEAREILLLAKTPAPLADALVALIRGLHSYETPEIVVTPIIGGDAEYLAWIREETLPAEETLPGEGAE